MQDFVLSDKQAIDVEIKKIVNESLEKKPLTKKTWKIHYNETTYKLFFIIVKIY